MSVTLTLLVGFYFKNGQALALAGRFLAGIFLAMIPWSLKSLISTGDPLYPYFAGFLKSNMVSPWHSTDMVSTSFQHTGWQGIWDYFSLLIGTYHDDQGLIQPPNWGPTIFFVLLTPVLWKIPIGKGFRLGILSAAIGWVFHLFYGLEIRYHLASVMALVCIPIVAVVNNQEKMKLSKRLSKGLLIVIGISFVQNLLFSHMTDKIKSAFGQMLSGYSPGNFSLSAMDQQAEDMRWVSHLINTKTAPNESVLLCGIHYSYGLKRKFYFSNDRDKDVLQDLAERSADSFELEAKVRDMGVTNLLINTTVVQGYLKHPRPELRLHPEDLKKMNDFINLKKA